MRDERRGNPTIVDRHFESTKRRVAHLPPQRPAHGVRAVVAEEQDQRVFDLPSLAQPLHDAREVLIDTINHRRVGPHPAVASHLLRLLSFGRDRVIQLRQPCGFRHETELLEPFKTSQTNRSGAICISLGILRDVFLVRLNRPVRSCESQIPEPRSRRVGGINESQRVIGEGVGGVKSTRQLLDHLTVLNKERDWSVLLPRPIPSELLARTADQRETAIEPARVRPALRGLPQMPLPRHEGLIACRTQHFGQGDDAARLQPQIRGRTDSFPELVVRPFFIHVANTSLMRIKPGHQRRSCRTALSTVVEPREPHAIRRQCIKRRRSDLPAITAEVRVTHIVDHDEQDVGPVVRRQ